jgi:hypothetical protein
MNIDESFNKVGKIKFNQSYLISHLRSHQIGVGRIRFHELSAY